MNDRLRQAFDRVWRKDLAFGGKERRRPGERRLIEQNIVRHPSCPLYISTVNRDRAAAQHEHAWLYRDNWPKLRDAR